jgi:cytochrome c peroxidase
MDAADRTAITRVGVNYGKAIHAFEHKLVSRDAPFDRFVAEGGRSRAISESARRGARLFAGAASCTECHQGPLFTDGEFHNVAVPQVGVAVPTVNDCAQGNPVCDCAAPRNCLPFGWFDGLAKLKASPLRRDGPFGDDRADTSRQKFFELEPQEKHKGAWKTPGLRDVASTAPYMHDGAFATLEEVVAHYNRGGSAAHAGSRDVRVTPLGLSAGDEADLVEFLKTLTGAPLPAELTSPPVLP